jgi:protein SCO1/2
MRRTACRRSLAALLLLATTAASAADGANAADDATLKAGSFDPPRQAPELTLAGSDGNELTLGRFRGKVVVLAFGFTSCADVCPVTLGTLAAAKKQLGAEGGDVQVVYVTVDPERDDAERMRGYLTSFDPSFLGGTGTPERLEAVRKEYGIMAEKVKAANGYSVAHSSYTYLIDRTGRLRALMPYGHPADDYVHDLRILLKQ